MGPRARSTKGELLHEFRSAARDVMAYNSEIACGAGTGKRGRLGHEAEEGIRLCHAIHAHILSAKWPLRTDRHGTSPLVSSGSQPAARKTKEEHQPSVLLAARGKLLQVPKGGWTCMHGRDATTTTQADEGRPRSQSKKTTQDG